MFPSGVNIVKNMTVLDPELCNTASTENRVGWEKPWNSLANCSMAFYHQQQAITCLNFHLLLPRRLSLLVNSLNNPPWQLSAIFLSNATSSAYYCCICVSVETEYIGAKIFRSATNLGFLHKEKPGEMDFGISASGKLGLCAISSEVNLDSWSGLLLLMGQGSSLSKQYIPAGAECLTFTCSSAVPCHPGES